MVERSEAFQRLLQSDPSTLDGVTTVSQVRLRGRRAMDQENLDHQMREEDAKVDCLRRKHLTPEDVEIEAARTKLTNDSGYVDNIQYAEWQKRVPELLKRKTW